MKLPARNLLGAAIVAAAISPAPATADQSAHCGLRDKVLARLAQAYGETRRSIGLGSDNAIVELFASDETGTWTILMTLPTGMTCLVASGRDFESLSDPVKAAETDA